MFPFDTKPRSTSISFNLTYCMDCFAFNVPSIPTGHSKYLDEFTYQDSDMNDVILSCMNNISLVGVSGRIFYGGNSAPVNKNIKIERVQSKVTFHFQFSV